MTMIRAAATHDGVDLFTISAAAIIAYVLAISVTHELAGHGLTALVLGAPVKAVASIGVDVDVSVLSPWAARAVNAAGCAANVLVGVAALSLLRRARPLQDRADASTRYFLWLFGHVNLFVAGGYLMALSFAPFGDWHDFTQGLERPILWRAALTLLGVLVSLATFGHAAHTLNTFTGRDPKTRPSRARRLTLVPYLIGSAAHTLAALFNPAGPEYVLISAAASSFGGTACLAFSGFPPPGPSSGRDAPAPAPAPLLLPRSAGWLALGAGALILDVFVLGPGLPRTPR